MAKTFIVIDDHQQLLESTCSAIDDRYPEAKIIALSTADGVESIVDEADPDLIMMDLGIPRKAGAPWTFETGLALLSRLFQSHKLTNFVVQSADPKKLIRLKQEIENHEGGFMIADKSLSQQEMLNKVELALSGEYSTREIRGGPELKAEWLQMLRLGLREALTDDAIAEEMHIAVRTVRSYWKKAQDALDIYPDKRHNQRIQTYNKARQLGLLD